MEEGWGCVDSKHACSGVPQKGKGERFWQDVRNGMWMAIRKLLFWGCIRARFEV